MQAHVASGAHANRIAVTNREDSLPDPGGRVLARQINQPLGLTVYCWRVRLDPSA